MNIMALDLVRYRLLYRSRHTPVGRTGPCRGAAWLRTLLTRNPPALFLSEVCGNLKA